MGVHPGIDQGVLAKYYGAPRYHHYGSQKPLTIGLTLLLLIVLFIQRPAK